MHKNVIFLGGIHGSGKGTIAKRICQDLELEHIVASEVIKWSEINLDASNKLVKNIPDTQTRLLIGLRNSIDKEKKYLLDGHFCLLNENLEIVKVATDLFFEISPILVSVKTCEIERVVQRLSLRDKRNYKVETLDTMQKMELESAQTVAELMGVPFVTFEEDESSLVNAIKNLI